MTLELARRHRRTIEAAAEGSRTGLATDPHRNFKIRHPNPSIGEFIGDRNRVKQVLS